MACPNRSVTGKWVSRSSFCLEKIRLTLNSLLKVVFVLTSWEAIAIVQITANGGLMQGDSGDRFDRSLGEEIHTAQSLGWIGG